MASRSAPRSSPAPRPRSAGAMRPSRSRTTIRDAWAQGRPEGPPPAQGLGRAPEGAAAPTSAPSSSAACKGVRPQGLAEAVAALKDRLVAEPQNVATRKASEIALEVITEAVPELVLGSADLTPSNNTKTKNLTAIAPGDYAGRYIHYGIREHGMAAAMNGIALHGGFVPAGATFLVFTDYARPAMRIAALAGIPVVYVMTHDFDRPRRGRPDPPAGRASRGASRHAEDARLPPGRRDRDGRVLAARARAHRRPDGARADPPEPAAGAHGRPATSNLSAHGRLRAVAGRRARPAPRSSPPAPRSRSRSRPRSSWRNRASPFASSRCPRSTCSWPSPRRSAPRIIGDAPVKVAVEAAVRFGWDAVIGPDGIFVGMNGFGASAPYKDLYRHFGITAEAVAEKVLRTHNL